MVGKFWLENNNTKKPHIFSAYQCLWMPKPLLCLWLVELNSVGAESAVLKGWLHYGNYLFPPQMLVSIHSLIQQLY